MNRSIVVRRKRGEARAMTVVEWLLDSDPRYRHF